METKETIVLKKIIETWITKNIDLVQKAQENAKKIADYKLIKPNTMPFQILPTNYHDADGDVICKLYIHIDSPLYGHFSVEKLKFENHITCPNIYITEQLILDEEEFNLWLNKLNGEMNEFHKISNAIKTKEIIYCILSINNLLKDYHKNIQSNLLDIKKYINENENIAIFTNNFYVLVKDAKKEYDKALLMPNAWIFFNDLNNLPELDENIDENIDEYINEIKTNDLQNKLHSFFKIESFYAAPVYLAQKILLENNIKLMGYSKTENEWQESKFNEDLGAFVLPAIDITEFKIH